MDEPINDDTIIEVEVTDPKLDENNELAYETVLAITTTVPEQIVVTTILLGDLQAQSQDWQNKIDALTVEYQKTLDEYKAEKFKIDQQVSQVQ